MIFMVIPQVIIVLAYVLHQENITCQAFLIMNLQRLLLLNFLKIKKDLTSLDHFKVYHVDLLKFSICQHWLTSIIQTMALTYGGVKRNLKGNFLYYRDQNWTDHDFPLQLSPKIYFVIQ